MNNVWQKTLVYLGLVEEPDEPGEAPARPEVEEIDLRDTPDADAGNVRPLRVPEPGAPHVRAMGGVGTTRVSLVEVGDFDDAEKIGARYRSGQPVLFDLSEVEARVARRVLDFVSGTTYALRGRLVPAGPRAFLLLPDGLDLPASERDRLAARGYEVTAGVGGET